MAFLCLLIYITFLLYPNRAQIPVSNSTRIWVRAAFALTFFQILLGGLVRHLGAGLACGDDWLSCGPSIWPSWQLGQLHMTHRLVGYVLVVIITVACIKSAKTAKKAESRFARITGLVVAHLVMIQILLGMATVATVRSVALVTAHTAIGALLLAALFLLLVTQKYPFKSDL
jgi:cytochrome c oxidase assembly protein subunit 15